MISEVTDHVTQPSRSSGVDPIDGPRLVAATDRPADPVIRTLLCSDLVDSTRLVAKVGDARAYEIATSHERAARDLLPRFHGQEIDKTDGFLLLFERPIDAVGYALCYHQALVDLSDELGIELAARVGIHLGEVLLRENSSMDVRRGAKRFDVEGIAKPTAARVMSLAHGRQTLLTHSAFDLARRSAIDVELPSKDVSWLAHGKYQFQGVDEDLEIFEVGSVGQAPLTVPADSQKARRIVVAGSEVTLGWRPAPGLEIPQRPNWTLQQRLGAGGFGEVWLAEQQKTGEHRVFKFCLEAERLRSLQHEVALFRLLKETLGQRDDIARVLDWNFDEAPYFLESEYTEGGNLVEWVESQGGFDKVPVETRLELVAQLADALGAAHSVGVLHKDVKPSNVLVYAGSDGRPKARLTDFGIGLVIDEKRFADHGITRLVPAQVVPNESHTTGTYLYMAPEVFEGKVATVQADVYALGILCYQMLIGDFAHPLSPGWRRDINDEILAEDIAQMVDGSPFRRPAAAAVAEQLQKLPERRAAATAERARENADRRRRLFASFGGLVSLVLIVVSVLAINAISSRREADRRRGQAEELIGYMLGDLRTKLRSLGRLDILDDVGDKALEYYASVPATDLSSDEILERSRALMQIGQLRITQGRPQDAKVALEESLLLVQGLVDTDPSHRAWRRSLGIRHYWIGRLLLDQGDLDGALARFQLQLEEAQRLSETFPEDPDTLKDLAYAHNNIGFYLKERSDLQGALTAFSKALEIKRTFAEGNPSQASRQLSLARGHNAVGATLLQLGDFERALESFRAEEAITEVFGAEAPTDTQWLRQSAVNDLYVGTVLEKLERPVEAQGVYLEALSIFEKLNELDATNTGWQRELAVTHRILGLNQLTQGETARALNHSRQSVELIEALVAKDASRTTWQRDLAVCHTALGQVLIALNQNGQSRDHAETAIEVLRRLVDASPKNSRNRQLLGESYLLLGNARTNLEDPAGAVEAWESALSAIRAFLPESQDSELRITYDKALTLLREHESSQENSTLTTEN